MTKKPVRTRSLGWALAAVLAAWAPVFGWPGHPAPWGWGSGAPLVIERVSYDERFDPRYDEPLDGYGEWVHLAAFDEAVWFPYVEVSWRPYTHGHWACTTLGMMWVAYEPWGRLTHHYGRWVYFDDFGWGWVPGEEYGPAWVTWVVADGYVGWAPIPPDGFRYRHGATYRYGGPPVRWGYPVERAIVDIDFNLFVFVSDRHFHDTEIDVHVLPHHRSVSFFREKKAVPIGRTLRAEHVRAITGERVDPVRVEQRSYRTGDRRVTDYEPVGQETRIRKARESFVRTAEPATARVDRRKVEPDSRGRATVVPAPRGEGGSSIRKETSSKSRAEAPVVVRRDKSQDAKERPAVEKERSSGAKLRSAGEKKSEREPAEARKAKSSAGSRKKR